MVTGRLCRSFVKWSQAKRPFTNMTNTNTRLCVKVWIGAVFVEQFIRQATNVGLFSCRGAICVLDKRSTHLQTHTQNQTHGGTFPAVTPMGSELLQLLYHLNAAITASNSPQVSTVQWIKHRPNGGEILTRPGAEHWVLLESRGA